MWNQMPSLKDVANTVQKERKAVSEESEVPTGYAETIECMNTPDDWDARGMIADMAEYLRRGNDVPPGQLLAALDWMTFRLKDARCLLVDADSELSAMAHGRPLQKDEASRISDEAREVCRLLNGFHEGR